MSRDDGRTWRSISDKRTPREARLTPVVPLADGRTVFAGRQKLRDFRPLQVYVGAQAKHAAVGEPIPAGCGSNPLLDAIGDLVFVRCEGAPVVLLLDLANGAWQAF